MGQQAPQLVEAHDPTTLGPSTREHTVVVAVLEAQSESFAPTMTGAPVKALPEPQREMRQLEGPPEQGHPSRDAA